MIEVELPVCPICGHVGKMPAGIFGDKTWCRGPNKAQHPRERKVPHHFRDMGPVPLDDKP